MLIFADLHGNWEALAALQSAEPRPDYLFFLGDAVGYGPDPQACVSWLRANVTHAVRGDHDDALGRGHPPKQGAGGGSVQEEYRELAQATLAHARRMLSPDDLAYLAGLPVSQRVELEGTRFYLTHELPLAQDLLMASEGELLRVLQPLEADLVFVSHTHVPLIRQVGETYVVNPGSLGQPRYGSPDATYAVWQDGELQIRHLHYPWEITWRKLAMLPIDPDVVEELQAILERGT